MGTLAIVWMVLFPLALPALLGVWVVRLWHDRLAKDAEIVTPAGIAFGISIVCAASLGALVVPELQKEIGPWVIYTGPFAAVLFFVGGIIGWIECTRTSKPKT